MKVKLGDTCMCIVKYSEDRLYYTKLILLPVYLVKSY